MPCWPAAYRAIPDPTYPDWSENALVFASRLCPRLAGNFLRQRSAHELIQLAIKNALRVRGFDPSAQVFHHLIGLQDVRSDLVAPARITLGVMGVLNGLRSAFQFQI